MLAITEIATRSGASQVAVENSVLDLTGNTPLLELERTRRHYRVRGRLLAKLEYLNPGGSKKDRIALSMIREARRTGRLREGQAFVEVTRGNTGTGLAIVCQKLGYPTYAVMSVANTLECAQMMWAFGAKVVLVGQATGSVPGQVDGNDLRRVKQCAAELVTEKDPLYVDQFENPANVIAHECAASSELWQQCGGDLDAIVAFFGSGVRWAALRGA